MKILLLLQWSDLFSFYKPAQQQAYISRILPFTHLDCQGFSGRQIWGTKVKAGTDRPPPALCIGVVSFCFEISILVIGIYLNFVACLLKFPFPLCLGVFVAKFQSNAQVVKPLKSIFSNFFYLFSCKYLAKTTPPKTLYFSHQSRMFIQLQKGRILSVIKESK